MKIAVERHQEPGEGDRLIAEYHDLLVAGDPRAEWEQLAAGMAAEQLRFRDRYLCNVLRPLLLPRARYQEVVEASGAFYGAIRALNEWLMEDESLRARMGLSPLEEAAIAIDPGFPSPDGIGRLDGFLDLAGNLRFVEFNSDSPGGMAYGQVLAELFLTLPVMKQFGERHRLETIPTLPDILATLLAHYHVWGGEKEPPCIGIIDWEGMGTATEFILCRDYFERSGYPALISHPAALAVRQGKLWDELSGRQVDIVYKRVLVGELLQRLGLDNVLTRAIRERAACVVNSYRAQLIFKKALFALLSELADDPHFTPAQRQAIQAHLPWTRVVREGIETYQGEQVELLPYLAARRDNFVLKPNSEYGGTGVLLGWETPPERWEHALAAAIEGDEPVIVQERIYVRSEPFPLLVDDTLRLEKRFVDLDPYTYAPGTVRGAGVRLGATGLLNVTAGGGSAVPMILVA
jgi:glutathionylspermidine synthase